VLWRGICHPRPLRGKSRYSGISPVLFPSYGLTRWHWFYYIATCSTVLHPLACCQQICHSPSSFSFIHSPATSQAAPRLPPFMSDVHHQCSNPPELVPDHNLTDPHAQDLIATTPKSTTAPVIHAPMEMVMEMEMEMEINPPASVQEPDAASTHSLPVVHVTAGQIPSVQPLTARSTDHSTSSPDSSNRLTTHIDRSTSLRNNRRSIIDVSHNYHFQLYSAR
jgi:hypothetical protein